MKTETPEHVAKGIVMRVKELLYTTSLTKQDWQIIRAIEAALNAERERAAKIAEDIMPIGADDCYWCERVRKAAAAIRGKD